mgnify:CR=1 FL=1
MTGNNLVSTILTWPHNSRCQNTVIFYARHRFLHFFIIRIHNVLITKLNIDKDVVDPDDVEMLQDLLIAAVNEGMRQVDAVVEQEMSKITGGLGIPGL